MNRKLVLTSRFKRSLRKFIKGNNRLQQQVEATLKEMTQDLSAPKLGTHNLKGELAGLKSCSCGYDCRIVFSIEEDETTQQEVIVLLNVGSHDDVY